MHTCHKFMCFYQGSSGSAFLTALFTLCTQLAALALFSLFALFALVTLFERFTSRAICAIYTIRQSLPVHNGSHKVHNACCLCLQKTLNSKTLVRSHFALKTSNDPIVRTNISIPPLSELQPRNGLSQLNLYVSLSLSDKTKAVTNRCLGWGEILGEV